MTFNTFQSISVTNELSLLWLLNSNCPERRFLLCILQSLQRTKISDMDLPIMLIVLPIMLCCTAQKNIMLILISIRKTVILQSIGTIIQYNSTVDRDHKGLRFLAQNYHPKTTLIFTFCHLGRIGQAQSGPKMSSYEP